MTDKEFTERVLFKLGALNQKIETLQGCGVTKKEIVKTVPGMSDSFKHDILVKLDTIEKKIFIHFGHYLE